MPDPAPPTTTDAIDWRSVLGPRSIVLIGMMGAGKTHVGRRLARQTGLPFVDADDEIELAAGCTIPEMFEKYGEPAFRDGEVRVIQRLLDGGPQILSTGGGAFMSAETRETVARQGVSVWLRAELDILYARTRRRKDRPLLQTDDPKATLRALLDAREPVYGQADVIIDTGDETGDTTARTVLNALAHHLGVEPQNPGAPPCAD